MISFFFFLPLPATVVFSVSNSLETKKYLFIYFNKRYASKCFETITKENAHFQYIEVGIFPSLLYAYGHARRNTI